MKQTAQKGFTLPELMAALLIFAAISAAGVYVLRLSVDAREQLEVSSQRLAGIESARTIIRDDLSQIALRPVRDEFGESAGPVFQGGEFADVKLAQRDETRILAFVRRGWSNPDWSAPRSSLQYVEYIVREDTLYRRTRAYLDDARDQARHERALFTGVDNIEIAFLQGEIAGELEWSNAWPVGGGSRMPKAVAITVTTDRYGALRHLFWLGAFGAKAT